MTADSMSASGEIRIWFAAESTGATIGGEPVAVSKAIEALEFRNKLEEMRVQARALRDSAMEIDAQLAALPGAARAARATSWMAVDSRIKRANTALTELKAQVRDGG